MHDQILGIVNPAIALLFAGTFALLWTRDRDARHRLVLALGYVLMACGFLTFHFTPDPNGALSILTMHAFYSGSIIALLTGACSRVGQRAHPGMLALVALGFAVLIYFTTFAADQNPRLIAVNTCYGVMLALGTQTLAGSARRTPIDRLLTWVFGITALQFLARPYAAAVFEGGMSAQEFRDSLYYAVEMVQVALWSLMLAMALVAACVIDQVEALRARSEIDPLTDLTVRRAFEREAVAMLDRAQQQGVPVSAIVADIDHFKRVNDMFGHQAGDNAIRAFGLLLGDAVRGCDAVGRVGGEEFCVFAWDCTGEEAVRLAERMRADYRERTIDGLSPDIRLTASFGVAQWRDGEGYGRLFGRADSALYRAKDKGRDRVEHQAPSAPVPLAASRAA